MNAEATTVSEQEPIGIVISRGPRAEPVPVFFSYVWADDPEPSETDEVSTAA
jgi:hypothetical protein